MIGFWVLNVCKNGENIAHLIQSNKPMYKQMEFYILNCVQLSDDFDKVVPSGTTQGKECVNKFEINLMNYIYIYNL